MIASPLEQKGGAAIDLAKCYEFRDWINSCNLVDLGTIGSRFTWRGPKWQNHNSICKRLDWVRRPAVPL